MSLLLRLERRIEALVEGLFARWAHDRVHPMEIGRRLLREMEAGALAGLGGTLVPNDYRVFLNPRDFGPYTTLAPALIEELAGALHARAAELKAQLPGPVRVALEGRDAVLAGEIYVEARMVPEPEAAAAGAYGVSQDVPPAAGGPGLPHELPHAGGSPVEGGQAGRPAGAPTDTRVYRRPGAEPTAWAGTSAPAHLRIVAGPAGTAGREILLDRPLMTIGRRADQDIVLDDPNVSRTHARIEITGGGAVVEDLGSTNGTFINGRRVGRAARVALKPGDRVQIGIAVLEYLGGP